MYKILKGQPEAVNPRKAERQYNRQMYKILKGQSEA